MKLAVTNDTTVCYTAVQEKRHPVYYCNKNNHA